MAENNIMPFYNSSEVFVLVKQYRNTIHSPWILTRRRNALHMGVTLICITADRATAEPTEPKEMTLLLQLPSANMIK